MPTRGMAANLMKLPRHQYPRHQEHHTRNQCSSDRCSSRATSSLSQLEHLMLILSQTSSPITSMMMRKNSTILLRGSHIHPCIPEPQLTIQDLHHSFTRISQSGFTMESQELPTVSLHGVLLLERQQGPQCRATSSAAVSLRHTMHLLLNPPMNQFSSRRNQAIMSTSLNRNHH